MKTQKCIILILFILLYATSLSATTYINVANVKTKKELTYPYKKLKSMGITMFYKQKSFGYAAYIGPFKSNKSLQYTYKKVKRSFPNAKIIATKSSDQKNTSQTKTASSSHHSGFITGVGVGYANAPSTHIVTSGSVTINEPKSSGMNYSLYGGYDFNNNLSLLLNYMYLNASDLEFHNIYASLYYRFEKFEKFIPFFGLSVGYSALKWNTSPIDLAAPSSNNNSADIMYGTEVGFNYFISKTFSFKLNYSCLFLQHTTNIVQDTTNTSKLEHNTLHAITTSLQYNF